MAPRGDIVLVLLMTAVMEAMRMVVRLDRNRTEDGNVEGTLVVVHVKHTVRRRRRDNHPLRKGRRSSSSRDELWSSGVESTRGERPQERRI